MVDEINFIQNIAIFIRFLLFLSWCHCSLRGTLIILRETFLLPLNYLINLVKRFVSSHDTIQFEKCCASRIETVCNERFTLVAR